VLKINFDLFNRVPSAWKNREEMTTFACEKFPPEMIAR
jgi:hypothetical protein